MNKIGVSVQAVHLQIAPPGVYADVLTLMVQPD